jgi:Ni/Co efflux regulator RcnB
MTPLTISGRGAARRLVAAAITAASLTGAFAAAPAQAKDDRYHDNRSQRVEQRQEVRQEARQEARQDARQEARRVVAPRQVRRWPVGRALPRDIRPHRYEYWARHKLRQPQRGFYYARIGDDLLLIRLKDHTVVRLVHRF